MIPVMAPSVESTTSADIAAAPPLPSTRSAKSAATRFDAATAGGESTARYAAFTAMYDAVTTSVPMSSARGIVRRASTVSSPVYVTMCQPPNANSPATVAVRNERIDGNAAAAVGASAGEAARAATRPATAISTTAPTLITVNAVWTAVPCLTPT